MVPRTAVRRGKHIAFRVVLRDIIVLGGRGLKGNFLFNLFDVQTPNVRSRFRNRKRKEKNESGKQRRS